MFPEGISVYAACTACQGAFSECAEVIDVPHAVDKEAVGYVAQQLRALTPRLEAFSESLLPKSHRGGTARSKLWPERGALGAALFALEEGAR